MKIVNKKIFISAIILLLAPIIAIPFYDNQGSGNPFLAFPSTHDVWLFLISIALMLFGIYLLPVSFGKKHPWAYLLAAVALLLLALFFWNLLGG